MELQITGNTGYDMHHFEVGEEVEVMRLSIDKRIACKSRDKRMNLVDPDDLKKINKMQYREGDIIMSIKLVSRAYNLNERLVKIVNPEIDIYESRKEVVPEEFTFKYRGDYKIEFNETI